MSTREPRRKGAAAAEPVDFFAARREKIARQIAGLGEAGARWRAGDPRVAPPSARTLELAGLMVSSLEPGHALPQVGPSSEGEVGFTWFVRGARVDATMGPDLVLEWYSSEGGRFGPGGEARAGGGGFPAALLELIKV